MDGTTETKEYIQNMCSLSACPFPCVLAHTFGISSVFLHRLKALRAATLRIKCTWLCLCAANTTCSFPFPKSGATADQ